MVLSCERQPPDLPGESLAAVRGRCLSSAWGGAHLFAFAGGEPARRLARRVAHGESLVDGWALYFRECLSRREDAAEEDHLYDLTQRRAALMRAQLDLELHLGMVDQEQALARLGDDRLCEDGALAELARLVRHPGDAVAAVMGWRFLKEARALLEQREGAGFSELAYHDRIVSHGPIPLTLVLQLEFGDDFPDTLCEHVLGKRA